MKASMLLAVAALSLGACQQTSDICGTLAKEPSTGAPQTSGEQLQILSSCMERWAARLARSNDPAPYVVRAAISNCDRARVIYAQWLERGKEGPAQETEREYWVDRMMFIVVQTRAGNCYKDA